MVIGRRLIVPALLAVLLALSSGVRGFAQAPGAARIVSTSPSITDTLFALGLGDRVVGVSNYCRFPREVVALPKVGTFLRPDAELIARLKPALVFVHAGPHSTVAQLTALGIRSASIETGDLGQVYSTIRAIAGAAGVAESGRRLTDDINRRLDRIRLRAGARPRPRVLIIVGRQTGTLTDIVAVGRGSYLSDIAEIAGGINVLDTATKYPRLSLETVISSAPDVLIDVGEMGESPDDSARRMRMTASLWQRQTLVKAVRDGRVHITTDDAFVVPGPRMIDVAEQMAEWFHTLSRP